MTDDTTAATAEKLQIYPFPGNTRSRVWQYFGFLKIKEGPPVKTNLDMTSAICRLCKKTYANKGNTTNLLFHLDHDHKDTCASVVTTMVKKAQPTLSTQPRIDQTVLSGRLTKQKEDAVNNILCKLLVAKALPLSLVEHKLFKEFCGLLEPRYKVPSRNKVVEYLEQKKKEMEEKVKKDLASSGAVAITHDGWTSLATESYDTVTAHFINDEWCLRSAVLQTRKVTGSHTGEKIAEGLLATKTAWNITPNITAVTDNAANEKKAFEVLQWTRFGCYGHRLNLVIKHSLEVPEIAKLLGKGRKLVSHFHMSTSVNDKLMEKQKLIFSSSPDIIGHKLLMDVPTRWNSSLFMLSRLAEQTPAIHALASDSGLSKVSTSAIKTFCYSFEEHSIVENLIAILEPFDKATKILCAESIPTMNKVLPTIAKVKTCLEAASNLPVIQNVVARMNEELAHRTEAEEIPLLAAMLSPDTKDLPFLSSHEKEEAYKLLFQKALMVDLSKVEVKVEKPEPATADLPKLPDLPNLPDLHQMVQIPDPDQPASPDTKPPIPLQTQSLAVSSAASNNTINESGDPPQKKIKCSDMEEWFADVIYTGESKQPTENVVEEEIKRYLASRRKSTEKLTLLEWWQLNEHLYPRLSILAKKYLAIPASSVPSERVFSLAGAIVNKKRSRLKPEKVDMIIFLNMNMKDYW